MSVSTKVASIPQVERLTVEAQEVSEGTLLAQRSQLSEMPGLVFGIMSIIYIVTSLWSLA